MVVAYKEVSKPFSVTHKKNTEPSQEEQTLHSKLRFAVILSDWLVTQSTVHASK